MSIRVETMLWSHVRLVGLRAATDGILASERASFDWRWLELALSESRLSSAEPAAWLQSLPTGRLAVCRLLPGTGVAGADWCVGVLVLDSTQYGWLARRLVRAIGDASFWCVERFDSDAAGPIPDWPEDDPPADHERDAVDRLIARGTTTSPGIPDAWTPPEGARLEVLRAPARAACTGGPMPCWSVGLPTIAPGAALACVAKPRGVVHSIEPPTPRVVATAVPHPRHEAGASAAPVVPSEAGATQGEWRLQMKPRTGGSKGRSPVVPLLSALLMGGATIGVAIWMRSW